MHSENISPSAGFASVGQSALISNGYGSRNISLLAGFTLASGMVAYMVEYNKPPRRHCIHETKNQPRFLSRTISLIAGLVTIGDRITVMPLRGVEEISLLADFAIHGRNDGAGEYQPLRRLGDPKDTGPAPTLTAGRGQ